MSTDTVDDLHYAEDLACRLLALSRVAVEAMKSVVDHAAGLPEPVLHSLLVVTRELDAASAEGYCRPSCQDGTCTDECGCPAHPDGQPHDGSGGEDQADYRVISQLDVDKPFIVSGPDGQMVDRFATVEEAVTFLDVTSRTDETVAKGEWSIDNMIDPDAPPYRVE